MLFSFGVQSISQLLQCNLVTSLLCGHKGCGGVVKISQSCNKLVTTMNSWSQGCSELVKGCDKVARTL